MVVSARVVSLPRRLVISRLMLARVMYSRWSWLSDIERAGALVSRIFNMAWRKVASEGHVGTSPQWADETASGLLSRASVTGRYSNWRRMLSAPTSLLTNVLAGCA